jgi:hypothetical protein
VVAASERISQMNTPLEVHYVIVSRRSAHKKEEVEGLFQGRSEFQVIVDRRKWERRKDSVPDIGANHRAGSDRRL